MYAKREDFIYLFLRERGENADYYFCACARAFSFLREARFFCGGSVVWRWIQGEKKHRFHNETEPKK